MLTTDDINSVKGKGFLINRGTENFSGRVVTAGGVYTTEQLKCLSECADRYGNGTVVFTSRASAEIPGISFERIPDAEDYITSCGLTFGGTGPKIRPIVACKGTTCTYGNIDTQGLARELHEEFYLGWHDVKLPHKFKIAVGGCPNSCVKPTLNDIGIEGHKENHFDPTVCHHCNRCIPAEKCPMKAITHENGKIDLDSSKCIKCGVCVGKCHFGTFAGNAEGVCSIYVGGTWGKTQKSGIRILVNVPADDVPKLVEKTILWYKENGKKGERFRLTLERCGIDVFRNAIFGNELLKRKKEILAKEIE